MLDAETVAGTRGQVPPAAGDSRIGLPSLCGSPGRGALPPRPPLAAPTQSRDREGADGYHSQGRRGMPVTVAGVERRPGMGDSARIVGDLGIVVPPGGVEMLAGDSKGP